jgi:hypothetical protein
MKKVRGDQVIRGWQLSPPCEVMPMGFPADTSPVEQGLKCEDCGNRLVLPDIENPDLGCLGWACEVCGRFVCVYCAMGIVRQSLICREHTEAEYDDWRARDAVEVAPKHTDFSCAECGLPIHQADDNPLFDSEPGGVCDLCAKPVCAGCAAGSKSGDFVCRSHSGEEIDAWWEDEEWGETA